MTDKTTCPLCGGPNACAMETGAPAEACWCTRVPFPADVLARVPAEARNTRCVCASCARDAATPLPSGPAPAVS